MDTLNADAASDAAKIREIGPGDTEAAHEAMWALRPAYGNRARFAEYVDEVLRPVGYRLIGSFPRDAQQAAAVAGFRVCDGLAWGRYLYVDDLSTALHARRQGHAGSLLEWLVQEGRRLGCGALHLDSGVGPERFDAHRLYQGHGLSITSHHFAIAIE